MSKSTTIKVLTNKDKELLTQLYRTAVITKEQVRYYNVARPSRMDALVKSKYIEKRVSFNHKLRRTETVYRLTDKGCKAISKDEEMMNRKYAYASVEHDAKLTDIYYSLSREEQSTWWTETDNRYACTAMNNEYKQDEERKISAPDGSYVNNQGVRIAVEIVTDNYGNAEIQAKEEFINEMKWEVNYVRV